MRDSFPERIKIILAARVGHRCSRPDCHAPTSGPQAAEGKVVNVGVAAHITAASSGGPRFDPGLSPESRSSETNGIWLCQSCAKLVDSDLAKFPALTLREWKANAEFNAQVRIGKAAGATVDLPLSSAEIELLHAASRDGDIWLLSGTQGTRVHTGNRDFRSDGDPSLEAGYLDALEALTRRSLARRLGDTHYKLTGEGFRVARELAGGLSAGDVARRPTVTRRRRKRSIGEAWSDRPAKPYLIEDISASGAFLQTDRPIDKGELLPLELALDDGSRIRVTAEVVRIQPPEWGRVGGIGVTFRKFHERSLEILERWVGSELDPPT